MPSITYLKVFEALEIEADGVVTIKELMSARERHPVPGMYTPPEG
jgi:hypothetical protein